MMSDVSAALGEPMKQLQKVSLVVFYSFNKIPSKPWTMHAK